MYLKLNDENAGKKVMLKDSNSLNHKVVSIRKVEANIKISKNSSQKFKITQFPLILTWAWTVQNVQGLALSTTIVSLELVKQRTFPSGQIYVAPSQSTPSKWIILSNFDPKLFNPIN